MEDNPRHLGDLIAALRIRSGDTAGIVVSDRFQISRGYAYWLETGWSAPAPELLRAILDAYAATPMERALAWELRATAPRRGRRVKDIDPQELAKKQAAVPRAKKVRKPAARKATERKPAGKRARSRRKAKSGSAPSACAA